MDDCAAGLRGDYAGHGDAVLVLQLLGTASSGGLEDYLARAAPGAQGSQGLEVLSVLLDRLRRLRRDEPVDGAVLRRRVRHGHPRRRAARRVLLAAGWRVVRGGRLAVRQGRRPRADMVGALGKLDLSVHPVLPANRLHGAHGPRPEDVPCRTQRVAIHPADVRAGHCMGVRQSVGVQVHLRRLSRKHRRHLRRRRPGRRPGWIHPARHVRRADGPHRHPLERLHAHVWRGMGIADLDVLDGSPQRRTHGYQGEAVPLSRLLRALQTRNIMNITNATLKPAAVAPHASGCPDIADWRPEDNAFWESTGKKIAYRNLWISVPALLCGFAVWGMWGIITVQMLNLGFPFTQAELFTLTAIAGIAGATMRIPASFLIRLAGGRNTIFLTTAMLLAPAIGTGIVLQHKDWPLWAFQLMALWSGVGGGNFASSMSNISTFFPKRLQGTALGLNAGLGNAGVTAMQIVIPLVMTVGIFGALGGEPMTLTKDSGWIFGKIAAGTPTWIQNAGLAWVLSLVPLSALCWFGMNNLKTVSPDTGNPLIAFTKITYLYTLAFVPSIFMLYLYLPAPTGLGVINMWVAIPLDIIAALLVMRLAAFGTMKEGVAKQFAIFRDKHTWSMTLLYIVTFGSFIGFSMALPLSMKVIFGVSHVRDAAGGMKRALNNPTTPAVLP